MDDTVYGLLFFLAIAGYGVVKKIYEERQEAQRRQTRKPVRPENLPEATRRQLYGDSAQGRSTEPPMAKPRTAPPEAHPRRQSAPPPLMPQRQQTQQRTAPPRAVPRPTPAQRTANVDDEASKPAGWEVPEGARGTFSEEGELAQRQRQLQQQLRQAEQRKRQAEQQAEHLRAPSRPPGRQPQRTQRPQPARHAHPQEALRHRMRELFRDPTELRKGIIFQQIMSPPPGLEDYR